MLDSRLCMASLLTTVTPVTANAANRDELLELRKVGKDSSRKKPMSWNIVQGAPTYSHAGAALRHRQGRYGTRKARLMPATGGHRQACRPARRAARQSTLANEHGMRNNG